MTPDELLATGKPHPEVEQILANGFPLTVFTADTDIIALRAVLAERKRLYVAARTGDSETAAYLEENIQIPVRDGTKIPARIHKPRTPPSDGSPIFVMYHGGGYAVGGLDNETLIMRRWAEMGGVAVNVDYRLAPEHPFPTGWQDSYDALKWASANFEKLGGNQSKGFFVGGISAGANFTSTLSLAYLKDELSPPLAGLYLSIPACISPEIVPEKYKDMYLSREQNKDAPSINASSIDIFEKHYKPDISSPMFTPMASSSLHHKLPPVYFQICGLDPLRDEAFIYERILREEHGIKTKVDVYPGLPHSFWSWAPEAQFSQGFEEDCVKGMQWLLEQSQSK